MNEKFINRSEKLFQEFDYANSLNYAKKALKYAKKIQDDFLEFKSLYLMTKSSLLMSKFENALDICNNTLMILDNHNKSSDRIEFSFWIASFYALKGRILFKKGDLEGSENYYNKCLPIFQRLNNKKKIAFALNGLSTVNDLRGDYLKAIHLIREAIKLQLEISDNKGISWSFIYLGNILLQQGSLESGLFYYELAFEKARNSNNLEVLLSSSNCIGVVYYYSGKFEIALEYYTNAYLIAYQIGNIYNAALILANIAAIFKDQGKYNNALRFLKKSLEIGREILNEYDLTGIYDKFAQVYEEQGRLKDALYYLQKSLKIQEPIGNKNELSYFHRNIGEVYQLQGDLIKAKKHFIEALELMEKSGNNFVLSTILFSIINLLIYQSDTGEARIYYSRLLKISNLENNLYIDLFKRISEAMMLKNLPQLFQKSKAKEIFNEILHSPQSSHQFEIMCKINLCEILLYEIQMTKNPETLSEIKKIIQELRICAEEENLFPLKINLLIYESQIATIFENYDEASELLDQGHKIALEKHLELLIEKIDEIKNFIKQKQVELPADYDLRITTHELRKPITVIKGFTELLLKYFEETEPEDRKKALRLILKNINNLNHMIEEIDELSSLKKGSIKCNKSIIEFTDFFHDLLTQYNVIYPRKINYSTKIEINNSILVNIDKIRIQQVFDNVIENANRFTAENGHIWITLNINESEVVVNISDDGCGIDQKKIKEIFNPFTKFNHELNYKGTGIGLFLGKIICEEHQGTITAKSLGIGHGSNFTITLPRL